MSASYNLYIGNKMVGIPYFNAPWFDDAYKALRKIPRVALLFNPVEHDRANGFEPMDCPLGTAEEAAAHSFDRRKTLAADWSWIAKYSTGMIAGPNWMESTGAKSEVACHHALGLPVWELDVFLRNWDKPYLSAVVLPPLTAWPRVSMPLADDEPDDGGFFCDCHG